MDKQFVEEWLSKLKDYWFNKDIDNAVSLFKKNNILSRNTFYGTLYNIRRN